MLINKNIIQVPRDVLEAIIIYSTSLEYPSIDYQAQLTPVEVFIHLRNLPEIVHRWVMYPGSITPKQISQTYKRMGFVGNLLMEQPNEHLGKAKEYNRYFELRY